MHLPLRADIIPLKHVFCSYCLLGEVFGVFFCSHFLLERVICYIFTQNLLTLAVNCFTICGVLGERAVSSVGRASVLQTGGRRFESCTAHHTLPRRKSYVKYKKTPKRR